MAFTGLATKVYKDPLTVQWMNSIKDNFDIHETGTLKAWVVFDGTTSTITAQQAFNVANITDKGTGDYEIDYTNDIQTTNYFVSITCREPAANNAAIGMIAQATSGTASSSTLSISTNLGNGTETDMPSVNVGVVGLRG